MGSDSPEPAPLSLADARLANWRILLPMPRGGSFSQLFLSGGSKELENTLVELGLAQRVSRSLPQPGSADLAVLLDESHPPLTDVAESLQPGGILYWQVTPRGADRLRATNGRILERVQTAGLTSIGVYWIGLESGLPSVFVPLDVSNAVSWYLDNFSGPLGKLSARFPRLSRALASATAPRIGIVAVRGRTAAEVDRLPSILAPENLPLALRSTPLRPVVNFREHERRAVVFPFTPLGKTPQAVLKFSPVPERGSRTTQEQQTLAQIRSRLDPIMAASIPEPLGLFEWSGLTVGIENYMAGRSIDRAPSLLGGSLTKNVDDLERVTAWLCRFHRQVVFSRPEWGAGEWTLEEWIERPLRRLESSFPLDPQVERLFAATRQRARELLGIPLPIVLSNWSLSLGNVIEWGDGIAVYDWETVSRGLPLTDLVYFAIDWGRRERSDLARSWKKTFAELLVGPSKDPVGSAIEASLARYMRELEIDQRFLQLLVVLTWVGRAERRLLKNSSASRPLDPRLSGLAEAAGDYFQT